MKSDVVFGKAVLNHLCFLGFFYFIYMKLLNQTKTYIF